VHKNRWLVAAPGPEQTCCVKKNSEWCCCCYAEQLNCVAGKHAAQFIHVFIHCFMQLFFCLFISHQSPPRVRCGHLCSASSPCAAAPCCPWLEAHVNGAPSHLPAPPCCSPSFSATYVLIYMHAMQPVACMLFSLCMLAGRSPTPLLDLERYQIEMLVDMGISDVGLYRIALTSPSAVSTDQIVASSFDRLEFLGDSVVGLVFRSWVYNRSVSHLTCFNYCYMVGQPSHLF